jgi:hypothetical protein
MCDIPTTPLTGDHDEWTTIIQDSEEILQNIRYPLVFKDKTGSYDTGSFVSFNSNGIKYNCGRRYIKFPYLPKVEFISFK